MKKVILISTFLILCLLFVGIFSVEALNSKLDKHGHHKDGEKSTINLVSPQSQSSPFFNYDIVSPSTLFSLNPETKLEGNSVFHFYKVGNDLQINTVLTYSKGNTTYIIPHSFVLKTPGDFSLHFSLTNPSKN